MSLKRVAVLCSSVLMSALFVAPHVLLAQEISTPGMGVQPCSAVNSAPASKDPSAAAQQLRQQMLDCENQLSKAQQDSRQGNAGSTSNQQNATNAALAAPTPLVRNTFQQFVSDTLGRDLPMFGYDLFALPPSTFAPVQDVAVPDDYILGPGDQIEVRIWGPMDFSQTLTVDRNGNIFLPRTGQLVVAGTRASQLNGRIRESLSRMFKNFEVTATVSQLRSIQVYVVGYAKRPGVYTVSALSTLVNTIFVSGGPSNAGSMRSIELRRGGSVVSSFDMYDLLTRGDITKDMRLQPGDVIFYPPVSKLVAIPAEVKVPAIYELKKESTIDDVVKAAGGFTTTAFTHEATVESIENRRTRTVERFALDEAGLRHEIRDGDLLLFGPISPRFDNAVTLRGNVARSGRYPLKQGMRVKDLIPSWQALVSPEYWQRINASSGKISESGIRSDVSFEMVDINWDYAMIERLDTAKVTTLLIPFNLGKAILEGDPEQNMELHAGDIITVFSQRDFRVPIAKRTKFVSLEGEFKTAGVYRLLPNETLPQLVERVGGFTTEAYPAAIQLFRESAQVRQKQSLQEFTARMEADVESAALNQQGAATSENNASGQDARSRLQMQREMVNRLKLLTPTGRIALRVKETADGPAELPNIELEDGDRITVPNVPVTVSVVGLVFNSGDFLFQKNAKISDYIRYAGGTARNADKGRTYVISANGEGRSITNNWVRGKSGETVRPGDTIMVPENPTPGSFMRGLRDWTSVLAQFGISAAAIKVLTQ
jgi:polysaccharide biosynthesis/export protein